MSKLSPELQAAADLGYYVPQHDRIDGNYGTPSPASAPLDVGQGHTVDELIKLDLPPIEKICGPLMSAGVTMMAGAAGVGKSLFALHMAAHIAAGEDLEAWRTPEPRRVLYVDGEMASQYLQGRAVSLPVTGDNMRIYHTHYMAEKLGTFFDLSQQHHRDFFLRDEIFHLNDVFFFDTVSSLVLGTQEADIFSPQYWLQLEPWHNQFRAAGKTVVWIDNLNKNNQVFGTSAKTHKVDSGWMFEPLQQMNMHRDATAGFFIEAGKIRGESDSPKGQWQYLKNYGWRLM